MKITVNKKEILLKKDTTIAELIVIIHCDTNQVAIERNCVIVPHSEYYKTVIQDLDVIECVEFIGGG